MDSTICQTEVILFINLLEDFYDPDGYFFKNGKDEFGGFYDDDLKYHPGPGNIHEFPDYQKDDDQEDDDMIRQYEIGHQLDEVHAKDHYGYHKQGYEEEGYYHDDYAHHDVDNYESPPKPTFTQKSAISAPEFKPSAGKAHEKRQDAKEESKKEVSKKEEEQRPKKKSAKPKGEVVDSNVGNTGWAGANPSSWF